MDTGERLTVLPMARCPGCRQLLQADAVQVEFRKPSIWWRATVADCYPLCLDCAPRLIVHPVDGVERARMEDDPFRDKVEMVAFEWWALNHELEWLRGEHPACIRVVGDFKVGGFDSGAKCNG